MRIKRARAFVIDFIILLIVFNIINSIIPANKYVTELKAEQNQVLENYTSHKITFNKYIKDYSIVFYKLAKEQKVVNIIYLIFVLLYFVVLPFLWKGRTIGSYINGIQVERFDKGKLHIHQIFIRNIVVVGLGYLLLSNICIWFLPSKYYFIIISIVGILQFVLAIFSANMIMFTKEKRGIQDLISNTEMAKIIK